MSAGVIMSGSGAGFVMGEWSSGGDGGAIGYPATLDGNECSGGMFSPTADPGTTWTTTCTVRDETVATYAKMTCVAWAVW